MTTETAKHEALVVDVNSRYGDAVIEIDRSYGDLVFVAAAARVHDLLAYLKKEKGFDMLLDIVGVDCLELEEYRERFEIEYVLYATAKDHRVRVRVPVPESDLDVPTATDLWRSANWGEREAFEMFGFNFVGHPCLKRLLTHHEFVGHPLRKDYPIMRGQWCTSSSDLTEELNE